ncbi:hypothetical protein PCE1_004193 [Barthelona sp. PCE]
MDIDNYNTFIFDCDGVLWLLGEPLKGAVEFLNYLHDENQKILFVTNNSTLSDVEYTKKFKRIGIEWVEREQILTSAKINAFVISKHYKEGKVLVLGEQGIHDEIGAHGIPTISAHVSSMEEVNDVLSNNHITYVVVGLDRHASYYAYAVAGLAVANGAKFLATNTDAQLPSKYGGLPGAGHNVVAVETVSNTKAIVTGKPTKFMYDYLKTFLNEGDSCIFFGDRLETDILFANTFGMDSCLVLSGVTTPEMLDGNSVQPTYVKDGLFSVLPR